MIETNDGADSAIAARTKDVSRIWKQPSNANCTSTFIDMAICKIKCTGVRIGRAVSQNQFEPKIPVGFQAAALRRIALPPRKILSFTGSEKNLDRINRRNRGDWAASRTNQSTHLQLGLPGDSIYWSNQAR